MAINSQPKTILIIPFILFLTIVANPLIKLSDSAGTTFNLIHRDQLPVNQHQTLAERVKQMLYRDMIRVQRIQTNYHNKKQQNVGPTVIRRQTQEVAVLSMRSGASEGTGQYFVEINVGTPVNHLSLVVDTGSELTWFDCNYTGNNNRNSDQKVVFDADHSTSFKTINCSSSTCQKDLRRLSQPTCLNGDSTCPYSNSYSSGSMEGIYARDTITFDLTNGSTRAKNNILIGCTNSRKDLDPIMAGANGILGLGNSPLSLLSQSSDLLEQKFSYCLMDMQSDNTTFSKLFLGSLSQGTVKVNGPMQTTKLELVDTDPLYVVNIKQISVNGEFSADEWNLTSGKGAVIDSGTTLANFVEVVYWPVINALNKSMSSFTSGATKVGMFDLCYAKEGFNVSAVPELEIGFDDGATFVVPGKNIITDVQDGGKNYICMAFFNLKGTGINVIGNLMQQNHLFEFDIKNQTLSFGSSNCT